MASGDRTNMWFLRLVYFCRLGGLCCLASFAAGCEADRTIASTSFAGGAAMVDAAPRDAATTLTWVDFAVAGCPSYDAARPGCQGPAPLELRFVAVAPAPIASYIWSFGDTSEPAIAATPSHRFLQPGTYTVKLTVGGSGGTAQATREMFVTVTAAPLGAACDGDTQCGGDGKCACGGGCPGLSSGFCSRSCSQQTPCPATAVCVDMGPRGAGDGWPEATCLVPCDENSDCSRGWICRDLPAAYPVGGWTHACFPRDILSDEGGSCVGAGGAPENARCTGGTCAPLGARGLCAATCDGAHPCASGASCATFADGEHRCLAACTAQRPCTGDPFLGCQTSNSSGRLGFSLADSSQPVCAPKRCTSPEMCGPDGVCDRGFCGKKIPGIVGGAPVER